MDLKEITAILRQIVKEETCQCGKTPLVGVVGGLITIVCDRCGNRIDLDIYNIEQIKNAWIQKNI